MKICSYIVKCDIGLAPNPYHEICTLAVCTPNHMRANLEKGDWIIGLAGKNIRNLCEKRSNEGDIWSVIYVMKINEILDLGHYYDNYPLKRPKEKGIAKFGDAIYKMDKGRLVHTKESCYHTEKESQRKDKKGNRVFIGKDFWYFGKKYKPLPKDEKWALNLVSKFSKCYIGIRYLHDNPKLKDSMETSDFNKLYDWLPKDKGLIK